VLASPRGPRCAAAEAVADEIAEHLPELASKRRLDLTLLLAALQLMPVEWQPAASYDSFREEAVRRMAGRDPEDWPTVAVALSLSVPVWSQDRDFEASGLRIYTTGELLDALGEAEA
jgi:predicted nucleic acid-binding protein